ncbi:hypothetical protein ACO2Q0_04430 [Phenylobacterium sp. VNQ135]|uniref:hypothetical protein n=1 Tax=Phenylobacterium sp. VNQ135 TaxID=3400922 RepID=UPI003C112B41
MRRYAASAVEQALWSLTNLGVSLLLARVAAPEVFGAFVFWASCAFVLSSVQNAVSVCHLQVLAPGPGQAPHRRDTERLMHLATAALLVLTALGALAAVALLPATSALRSPAAAFYLPAFLLQQYVRALTFSRGHPLAAALQTGLVLVAAVLCGLVLWASGASPDLDAFLWLLGAAYGIVGLGGALVLCRGQLRGELPPLSAYAGYARRTGWVLLGVSAAELLTRFYAFVVAARFGAETLAGLAAAQLLLRPVPLMGLAWGMVGRADLAARRDAADWSGFRRLILIAMVGGLTIAAVWTAVVAGAWPVLAQAAFGGRYMDLGGVALLWGVSSALSLAQSVLNPALQALKAFRPLALANAAAAAIAATAVLGLSHALGPTGAIWGMAAGQVVDLAAMGAVLASALAARRRAA